MQGGEASRACWAASVMAAARSLAQSAAPCERKTQDGGATLVSGERLYLQTHSSEHARRDGGGGTLPMPVGLNGGGQNGERATKGGYAGQAVLAWHCVRVLVRAPPPPPPPNRRSHTGKGKRAGVVRFARARARARERERAKARARARAKTTVLFVVVGAKLRLPPARVLAPPEPYVPPSAHSRGRNLFKLELAGQWPLECPKRASLTRQQRQRWPPAEGSSGGHAIDVFMSVPNCLPILCKHVYCLWAPDACDNKLSRVDSFRRARDWRRPHADGLARNALLAEQGSASPSAAPH